MSLKTNSAARLQISNLGGSSMPSRIDLNLGNLTVSTDTVHGELRFARGDNSALRYHSILQSILMPPREVLWHSTYMIQALVAVLSIQVNEKY